jgi:outer membrane immunogenic protein
MITKRLTLLSIVLAALTTSVPAWAQSPPPMQLYKWTGFYAGVNLGGASGSAPVQTSTVFSPTGYFLPSDVPSINDAGHHTVQANAVIAG